MRDSTTSVEAVDPLAPEEESGVKPQREEELWVPPCPPVATDEPPAPPAPVPVVLDASTLEPVMPDVAVVDVALDVLPEPAEPLTTGPGSVPTS